MDTLFKNIKGALSTDHLKVIVNAMDLNPEGFRRVFESLTKIQQEQFEKYEKSFQSRQYREHRHKLPSVNFSKLPPSFSEQQLNDILTYYHRYELWHAINELFTDEQLRQIFDKEIRRQKEAERKRLASMSAQQKTDEEQKLKKALEEKTSRFSGNLGEPETLQEFNNYDGHPPGHDDSGNKIEMHNA